MPWMGSVSKILMILRLESGVGALAHQRPRLYFCERRCGSERWRAQFLASVDLPKRRFEAQSHARHDPHGNRRREPDTHLPARPSVTSNPAPSGGVGGEHTVGQPQAPDGQHRRASGHRPSSPLAGAAGRHEPGRSNAHASAEPPLLRATALDDRRSGGDSNVRCAAQRGVDRGRTSAHDAPAWASRLFRPRHRDARDAQRACRIRTGAVSRAAWPSFSCTRRR